MTNKGRYVIDMRSAASLLFVASFPQRDDILHEGHGVSGKEITRCKGLCERAFATLLLLALSGAAHAVAPAFTGLGILTPLTGGVINLRSQGAITGTAPMRVQTVSVLPIGLGVQASVVDGVCIQITNALGIDLSSVGAVVSVLVTNSDAPRGVRGTMLVLPGLASNNNLGTCADPSLAPVANAGGDRTIADADGAAGELVTLNGSGSSDPDGSITSYLWTDLTTGQVLGNTAVLQVRLGDGNHQLRLTVTDNSGSPQGTASSIINLVVQAAAAAAAGGPTANPGPDRNVLDTDGLLGELVTLDASASISVGGAIASFEWLDAQQNLLGVGVSVSVRLPDGVNAITLRVTNTSQLVSIGSLSITVGTPLAGGLLQSLVNLTPEQEAVATVLDDMCSRLDALSLTRTLLPEELDLLNRCSAIAGSVDPVEQADALEELGARELTALRTQALLFSTTQNSDIMNHLAAMRSGTRKFSLAGLSVKAGDQVLPVDQLQLAAQKLWEILGGGASADDSPDPLLSDRVGLWLRGNYDAGDKTESVASAGFRSRQWGVTGGADYRMGSQSVVGLALGYGKSDIDYDVDDGGLATRSWTASLYGSTYPIGNLFLDAVFNYASANYDTTRHIQYSEGGNAIERTASGQTDGATLSGGITLGYDWNRKGFTISPAVGYFLSRAKVDGFDERGGMGLDLAYEEQRYRSSTANVSLAMNYALSTPWMVLLPHVRAEYLHEFNDDVEVFNVRFAHDPFADAATPTPLIVVQSDDPDLWYWRLAAGLSAQFKYGLSAYVEYQRLEDFQFVDFANTTVGLRLQHAF